MMIMQTNPKYLYFYLTSEQGVVDEKDIAIIRLLDADTLLTWATGLNFIK